MKDEKLIADSLMHNEKIKAGKKLLLEAIQEHQKEINHISPSKKEFSVEYNLFVEHFSKLRGGSLWYPYIGSGIGKGPFVELLDGSIKLDFISGIGVHFFGHSHLGMIEASLEAAISDTVMQGNLQQNKDALILSQMLIEISQLDHCFLSTSGAMSNENGFKIIFQKKFPAHRLLAFEHCFAGRTLTLASITDKPSFREGLPSTISVDYIPFYNPNDKESINKSAKALKEHLKRYPKQHAGMIFELIQGENGFYPGTKDFFYTLMDILRKEGIAIFVDEVQTFGRTSQFFAYQHFELESYVDVVTIGKLSQITATLFKKEFAPKPGLLSQTFTSSTAAIRAAIYTLKELQAQHFFGENGKNNKLFHYFSTKLEELAKRYPHAVKGPFGMGTMIAFTPFDGSLERAKTFSQKLFEMGLISFIAGTNPTRIRFLLPAGVLQHNEIDLAIQIIEKAVQSC